MKINSTKGSSEINNNNNKTNYNSAISRVWGGWCWAGGVHSTPSPPPLRQAAGEGAGLRLRVVKSPSGVGAFPLLMLCRPELGGSGSPVLCPLCCRADRCRQEAG